MSEIASSGGSAKEMMSFQELLASASRLQPTRRLSEDQSFAPHNSQISQMPMFSMGSATSVGTGAFSAADQTSGAAALQRPVSVPTEAVFHRRPSFWSSRQEAVAAATATALKADEARRAAEEARIAAEQAEAAALAVCTQVQKNFPSATIPWSPARVAQASRQAAPRLANGTAPPTVATVVKTEPATDGDGEHAASGARRGAANMDDSVAALLVAAAQDESADRADSNGVVQPNQSLALNFTNKATSNGRRQSDGGSIAQAVGPRVGAVKRHSSSEEPGQSSSSVASGLASGQLWPDRSHQLAGDQQHVFQASSSSSSSSSFPFPGSAAAAARQIASTAVLAKLANADSSTKSKKGAGKTKQQQSPASAAKLLPPRPVDAALARLDHEAVTLLPNLSPASTDRIFRLHEHPNKHQRKSYKSENRYMAPNPLVITCTLPRSEVQLHSVSVCLAVVQPPSAIGVRAGLAAARAQVDKSGTPVDIAEYSVTADGVPSPIDWKTVVAVPLGPGMQEAIAGSRTVAFDQEMRTASFQLKLEQSFRHLVRLAFVVRFSRTSSAARANAAGNQHQPDSASVLYALVLSDPFRVETKRSTVAPAKRASRARALGTAANAIVAKRARLAGALSGTTGIPGAAAYYGSAGGGGATSAAAAAAAAAASFAQTFGQRVLSEPNALHAAGQHAAAAVAAAAASGGSLDQQQLLHLQQLQRQQRQQHQQVQAQYELLLEQMLARQNVPRPREVPQLLLLPPPLPPPSSSSSQVHNNK